MRIAMAAHISHVMQQYNKADKLMDGTIVLVKT